MAINPQGQRMFLFEERHVSSSMTTRLESNSNRSGEGEKLAKSFSRVSIKVGRKEGRKEGSHARIGAKHDEKRNKKKRPRE